MQSEYESLTWQSVRSEQSFIDFLSYNFNLESSPEYLSTLRETLYEHEYRSQHPLYFPFASRIILTAAEFQFPELRNHIVRHNTKGWYNKDFMSPIHLLAMGVYMAREILPQIHAKTELIENLYDARMLTPDLFHLVLATWVPPKRTFPSLEDFTAYSYQYQHQRHDYDLPVYIPDTGFLRELADIPITGDQADRITRGEFRTRLLLPVQRRIFPQYHPADVAELFISDLPVYPPGY